MADLILIGTIILGEPDDYRPPFQMQCESSQKIIGKVLANEDLSRRQKDEVIDEILRITPINCAVPQLM